MAEEGDSGEKTESPTARRITEARKEGQVGVSTDFSNVFGITGAFLALQFVMPYLWNDIQIITKGSFTSVLPSAAITPNVLHEKLILVIGILLPELLIIVIVAAFCGAGCTAVQTKFLWSWKLLKPKLSHINPVSGLKRIVSVNNLVNTAKSIAKLCIILPVAYFAFLELFPSLLGLMEVPVTQLLPSGATAAATIFWRIIAWLLVLAIFDLIWQKYNNFRQLKMSKQEVKDEKKSIEGDEATKRKIVAIGLQRARERMFTAVPTADVVVTNPTHFAVALSYSQSPGSAPKVVAKGRGHIARRIRELARENGVPIVERKPLAQALFKMCEVGQEIPYELFRSVAELLAYVYRLKGKIPQKAKTTIEQRQQQMQ